MKTKVRKFMAKGWKPALLMAALLLFTAASSALAEGGNQGNKNIMPPQSHPYGKSYGEWGDAWWQWALSIPAASNPMCDTTGANADIGQSGDVWFLAGNGCGLASSVRTVTVPEGTALFFPIYNWAWVNMPEYGDAPWDDDQEAYARQYVAEQMDAASGFACKIDGRKVLKIPSYRCQTPEDGAFMVSLPEGNIFRVAGGIYGPSVADGIFLMVAPLQIGHHTIQWESPNGKVTYHITVVKPPKVFPPKSHPFRKTYGEWSAEWWKWAYSLPVDQNPFFDETGCQNGANGQSGPVWFLTGVINTSGSANRTCTVPADKALFFPILNVECATVEGNGATEAELRACVEGYIASGIAGLACEVDGVPIKNIESYRTPSPLFDYGPLPENNVPLRSGFPDAVPGAVSACVADGFYVMLKPLTIGQHTIHFKGTWVGFSFTLDITYHLTVVKPPEICPPDKHSYGRSLREWLTRYWQWYYSGADLAHSKVGDVQLMPLPAGVETGGAGTSKDPTVYVGKLEMTVPAETPIVLPEFAWVGERYEGYPTVPDDLSIPDDTLLESVHPTLTIDGLPVLTDATKADYYVPVTYFRSPVIYPNPSSYGSVAALYHQGVGVVIKPLPVGQHTIHLYEPWVIDWPPAKWAIVYDNTWIVTVTRK